MEPSYGTLTYKVMSPKWRESKERPLVSLLGIIRLVPQEVLRICLRTWICHCSRKIERSFDSRFLFKLVEGLVPAIPSDTYLTPITNKRKVRATRFIDFEASNIVNTTNNSKCFAVQNIAKQLWEDTRFLFAPVSVNSRWQQRLWKAFEQAFSAIS